MITFNYSKNFTVDQIIKLFKSVEWESANYPKKLFKSLKNSETVITLYDENNLIGLMSAISDGGMNVYFPYLLIDPEYHGKGLGKITVEKMLEKYGGFYRKILVCSNEKVPFYTKCGMTVPEDQLPMMKIN